MKWPEVVFNSGGTEGDNTALFGLLHPGDHPDHDVDRALRYPPGSRSCGALRGSDHVCRSAAQRVD